MNFDEVQRRWQSHDHGAVSNVDMELVLTEFRRKQAAMDMAVLQRDYVEVGLAMLMAGFWLYGAIYWGHALWSVTASGCAFVAVFLAVDRWIQRRRHSTCDSTLASCLDSSMTVVRHQIWLLRNVIWWYLLPLWIGMVAFAVSMIVNESQPDVSDYVGLVVSTIVCTLVFFWVYRLNQRTVEQVLNPRWQELQALKASLEQER